MKMKKLVALGAAAAMSMTMCVNVFADVTVSSEDAKFGSYENGVAKLADTSMIDDTHQWTVVIIDAEKDSANLTAEDLYYINQSTSADGFWVTNGMGTKVDLTTLVNETTTEKNFIIRIGGETITSAEDLIEVPFKITYGVDTPTYTLGDVDGVTGVNVNDATTIIKHLAGSVTLVGDLLLAADVDGVKGVNVNDATTIIKYLAGSVPELTPPAE